MKKVIIIVGALLISMLLITGSVVGVTEWVRNIEGYENTTNPGNILYAPDQNSATIGTTGPNVLGEITVRFSSTNLPSCGDYITIDRGPEQWSEEYRVQLICVQWPNDGFHYTGWEWSGLSDTTTQNLQITVADCAHGSWMLVRIDAQTGAVMLGDLLYGPEIDAVGWY